MAALPTAFPRTVRSYVGRGRLTRGQRRALERLWPVYGVGGNAGPLQLDSLFGRRAPCHLEIGFGMGDVLLDMAAGHPAHNYLGIEVYAPGIGSALRKLHDRQLHNVRLLHGDAMTFLSDRISPASLAAVYVFFPDPWPKKRHHKRRLVHPDFVSLVARALEHGGRVLLATDWQDYADHILQTFSAAPEFINAAGGGFARRPDERPLTKFESRGRKLGHSVYDLEFIRR